MIELKSEKYKKKFKYEPVLNHNSEFFPNESYKVKSSDMKINERFKQKINLINRIYVRRHRNEKKTQNVLKPLQKIHYLIVESPVLGKKITEKPRSTSVMGKRSVKFKNFNKFEELTLPILSKLKD